jgi:hypothetical protein
MQTQYTVTTARLAALREEIRQTHPTPGESVIESRLHEIIDAALDRLRDQYRTDAIGTSAFIRRIPPAKYVGILAASEQVPELAAYLARLDSAAEVWLGSPETIAGVAALVAMELLTQGEAAALLAYPLPELPA